MNMRAIHSWRYAWGWGLLVLLAGATALGQSHVRIVVISYISHRVQLRRPAVPGNGANSVRWTTAMLNAPIIEGESVRTRINSEAEVELECGSALRLAPDSELDFNRLRLSSGGVYVTAVTLNSGEAFFTMQDADSRDFHAQVPGAVISMPKGGAKLRLEVPPDQPPSVEVLDGKILVQAGSQSTWVTSSRRFVLEPGGRLQFTAKAAPDTWQQWSHRRDVAFERAEMHRGPSPPPLFTAAPASDPMVPNQDPSAGRGWNPSMPAQLPGFSQPPLSAPASSPALGPVPAAPYCAHR